MLRKLERLGRIAAVGAVALLVAGACGGSNSLHGAASVNDLRAPGLGNGGYDVKQYDVSLVWDNAEKYLTGTAEITVVTTQDVERINFDFADLQATAITSTDGQNLDFSQKNDELVISLDKVFQSGEELMLSVDYEGTPTETTKGIFGGGWRQREDFIYVLGEPFGAAHWFPVNDHISDKAQFSLQVTTDASQNVFSNGTLVDKQRETNGDITWSYAMEQPIASYLTTLLIGDFVLDEQDTVNGVAIRNVFPASLPAAKRNAFDSQDEMLQFFSDQFGPFPFDVYGSAVVDDPNLRGALENQTLSVFGSNSINQEIIAHELAHQWFGDSVTPTTFGDLWLNEGFATYGSYLWFEFNEQRDIERVISRHLPLGVNLASSPARPPEDAAQMFSPSVYIRGAFVLHALRLEVGDETFFEILQNYAETYKYGNASTQQFIDVAERTSEQDLSSVFDVWLFADELPDTLGSIDLSAYQ